MDATQTGTSIVRAIEHGLFGEPALAVAPAASADVLPVNLVRCAEAIPSGLTECEDRHSEEIVDRVALRRSTSER